MDIFANLPLDCRRDRSKSVPGRVSKLFPGIHLDRLTKLINIQYQPGVSPIHITRILAGQSRPSASLAICMVRVLGLGSTDQILNLYDIRKSAKLSERIKTLTKANTKKTKAK